MAIVTIDRPGVQVIQEFQAVSPTILRPTMPACVMGPCFQVVEAIDDEGAFVAESLLAFPARLNGLSLTTPFEYSAIGGKDLVLSVNNAAPVTITFSGAGALTVDAVVDEISTAAIPGLVAEVEEVSATQKRLALRTTLTGDNASLQVATGTHADVLTAFGFTSGQKDFGASGYNNWYDLGIQFADYPDPRSNLDELDIDFDTVRVFMNDGAGNVIEALRTETFLQGAGTAVSVADDGDGDNLSPYLEFAAAVFAEQAAEVTGSVDWTGLTYPGDFGTLTLDLEIDGAPITVTFASPGDAATAVSQLDSGLGVSGSATLDGSNQVVITSATKGAGSSVEILSTGTISLATIGLVAGTYAQGSPSNARVQGTSDLSGLTFATDVHNRVLVMSLDGGTPQTLQMPDTIASAADIITAITDLFGAGAAELNGENNLVLNSLETNGGVETSVRILDTSDATLLTNLGISATATHGNPFPPAVGDEVWVDGIRIGEVTEIPVSPTNRLRLSEEQLLTYTGSGWYIIAKNLDNSASSAQRPSSDLIVNATSGEVLVKQELFRETDGAETKAGPLSTYLAYTALRQDVSPAGEDFNLLRFGTTTDLEAALAPLDTQNPLGLGLFLALQNAPGLEVTGLGVGDTTEGEPEGTLLSYTSAFEYLESKDVYSIAPLTHALLVAQTGQAHVDEMSKPENGQERMLIYNPRRPVRKADTLVASTATANVSGAPTDDVQTGIANLQALLAAAGKPGPAYTESDGVYIEFENDSNKYLVQSVSGGVITVNNGPLSSTTIFYEGGGSPVFTSIVVDRPMSVKILGGSLGSLTDEAVAYGAIAQGFRDRRVVCTAPDKAKTTIDGLDTIIEGYYFNAALAGQMSAVVPQQGLTEAVLAGFNGAPGSNDRYGELQLKIMNGAGLWIFYQETDTSPVQTRFQVTTDMTTVEKREDSIRRVLDFTAKTVRASLRTFIGGYNITTTVQEAINSTLDGIGRFLVKLGVLTSWEVNAIRQSQSQPDLLEVDVTVGVPYPLNYIRTTLVV